MLGMDLVVDASVVVKWFVDERGSPKARLLMEDFAARDVEIHVPSLLPVEVVNALRYHPGYAEPRLLQAQASLDRFGLREYPFRGEHARRAIHLAHSKDLAVYDATYLALARELGVRLVSADEALLSAADADGLALDDYAPVSEA